MIRFDYKHTFSTKRSVPAGRTFAHEGSVAVFAYTVPFVLALEFGTRYLLAAGVSGEFLNDWSVNIGYVIAIEYALFILYRDPQRIRR